MRWPLVLLIFLLLFLVYNSHMLLYPFFSGLNPCTSASDPGLDGRTLFISDLHIRDLGKPDPVFRKVGEFARREGIGNVIVVGDFFESTGVFYDYSGGEEAFIAMKEALGLEDERLFVIIGSPVHDPQDMEVGVHGNVTALGKCGVFDINGTKVIAYHGDHLSRQGTLGFAVSYVTRRLFLERSWKTLSSLGGRTMVVTGHTHIPGVDEKNLVANPGGWKEIHLFKPPLGRGIVADENGFKLVEIQKRG